MRKQQNVIILPKPYQVTKLSIMKFSTSLLTFFLLLILSLPASSQELSKEELAQLKKELKLLKKNPARLKQMRNEAKSLDRQYQEKDAEYTEQLLVFDQLSAEAYTRDTLLNSLQRQRQSMTATTLTSPEDNPYQVDARAYFRVQVGAYRNSELSQSLENQFNFVIEADPQGGLSKYLIGSFKNYWEAKSLASYLINSGSEAFVVGYLDNQRVTSLKDMPQEYF